MALMLDQDALESGLQGSHSACLPKVPVDSLPKSFGLTCINLQEP